MLSRSPYTVAQTWVALLYQPTLLIGEKPQTFLRSKTRKDNRLHR